MLEEDLQQKNITVDDYLRILVRRRWWLLLPVFLGWAVVWGISWILPSSYRSETVILVERQKVPEQYVVPNIAVDLQERLQSMTQQILSRTRLEKIIEDFHLYQKERGRMGPDQVVEQMRKDIAIDLVEAPDRKELTAFKISYSASSAKLAQQVTSELTSLFIDENLRAREQQSESTTSFLQNQLADARKDLDEQEAKLKQYKTEYLGQLPEQLQSNVEILAGLHSQLQTANEALHQAQQQKLYLDSLASHYRGLGTDGGSENEKSPDDTADQLQKLKNQLADYSSRYTDNYPDVVHLKEEIARLEKQQQASVAAAAKTPASSDQDPHPTTYAQLQAMSPMMQVEGQIKANDLEIKNREHEVQELQQEVDSYRGRLNMTPLREQQLADLTRNHQQAVENYQSLLNKEMQSELATNLEKRQEGEQFSIIDPPSLPLRPYWPDRLNFSFLGLALGLALAICLTAGLELVQNRVRGEKDAASLLPVPILASIPLIISPAKQKRLHRRVAFESVLASTIVAIIVVGNLISYYRG